MRDQRLRPLRAIGSAYPCTRATSNRKCVGFAMLPQAAGEPATCQRKKGVHARKNIVLHLPAPMTPTRSCRVTAEPGLQAVRSQSCCGRCRLCPMQPETAVTSAFSSSGNRGAQVGKSEAQAAALELEKRQGICSGQPRRGRPPERPSALPPSPTSPPLTASCGWAATDRRFPSTALPEGASKSQSPH
jgi:hypothetical protein